MKQLEAWLIQVGRNRRWYRVSTYLLVLSLLLPASVLAPVTPAFSQENSGRASDTQSDGLAQSVYLQEKFDAGEVQNPPPTTDFHRVLPEDVAAADFDTTAAIASDDFNQANLDLSLWSFVNPLNDGWVKMMGVGSGDAHLELHVPEGASHDPWEVNRSVRVMQDAPNGDFQVVVKFDSVPSQKYQTQGVIVEQDENNWLRLELQYDGGEQPLRIFTVSTTDGTSIAKGTNDNITVGAAAFLRVQRVGNDWTIEHSTDGVTWGGMVTFTHAMTVSKIGPFAANHATSGNAPAFAARVDYFENSAAPITDEDVGSPPDVVAPLQHGIMRAAGSLNTLTVTWYTDEPSDGRVDYGPTAGYGSTVTDAGGLYRHEVVLTGLTANQTYHMRIRSTDGASNTSSSGDIEFVFEPDNDIGPNIVVWYGDTQQFGQLGSPQPYVNVVGNVNDSNGVVALSYTLNDGAPVKMGIGPDGRRLVAPGDFNVDLPVVQLANGTNVVELSAIDSLGNVSTKTVTVNYQSGNVWPLPYSIDWGTISTDEQILTKAEVIDGKWALDGAGARTAEVGYDRFLGMGDLKWNDYEVLVPVTLNVLPDEGQYGVGVVLRWQGHSDVPHVCGQPKCGWLPLGAIAWYTNKKLQLYGNDGDIIGSVGRTLQPGLTYWFKARVETNEDGGAYSMKVWQDGTTEPAEWDVTAQETLQDPQRGSTLLISHKADVTFGNVSITPVGSGENFSPVANDDAVTVASDGSINIDILANDTDAGGVIDPTTVSILTQPSSGTLSVDAESGVVSYRHNGDTATSDSFTYRVADDEGALSNTATVRITISDDVALGLISDDFGRCELQPFWNQINPLGDGAIGISGAGTGDAYLALSLPAGAVHNVWGTDGINEALRVMQEVPNADFEVEVGFKSEPSNGRNNQGILVEQDADNFLRFDVYHTGTNLRIFMGKTIDGIDGAVLNQNVPISVTRHLRVDRTANAWTLSYSPDGEAWTEAGSFDQALTVQQVGVFAANAEGLAFTAEVDYVFNGAAPIEDEDGARNTLTLTAANGEIAPVPQKEEYACDEEVTLTATPYTGYVFNGWTGDLSGSNNPGVLTIKGPSEVTALFVSENADVQPPVITLIGANPLDHEAGTPYAEPGAVAFDNVDGDITNAIVIGGDTVAPNGLGSYLITYDVSDSAGNAALQKTRTVYVVDTTPPVITLLGDNPLRLEVGAAYADPGYTAFDSFQGDLSSAVVVGGDSVNTSVAGTYTVTYNVSDSSGNNAEQVTRTVIVGAGTDVSKAYLPLIRSE